MESALDRSLRQNFAKKQMQSLLGIVTGVMADGVLNNSEVLFLQSWLLENREIRSIWPASVISRKLSEVLADGRIDEAERKHLAALLTGVAGVDFLESGSTTTAATQLPIEDCVTIKLPGSYVCHTGEFYYGTRAACERLTLKAGATLADSITKKVEILVIGSFVSRNWIHSTHGRKIEAAVKHQEQGSGIEIISERRWLEALDGCATNDAKN